MKKLLIISFFVLICISCSNSKSGYINPYLPNNAVNVSLNLNFANYDKLRFPNGYAIEYGQGAGGPSYGAIIVINLGGDQYRAYDLMCPNHPINLSCSRMTPDSNGSIFVTCHCTNEHDQPMKYSLITGTSMTPGAEYQMKPYPAARRGDVIYVSY